MKWLYCLLLGLEIIALGAVLDVSAACCSQRGRSSSGLSDSEGAAGVDSGSLSVHDAAWELTSGELSADFCVPEGDVQEEKIESILVRQLPNRLAKNTKTKNITYLKTQIMIMMT